MVFVKGEDVLPLTGEGEGGPFWGTEEEMVKGFDSGVEAGRVTVVFLGVDEKGVLGLAGDSGDAGEGKQGVEELQKEGFVYKDFKGAPYFAVDVTPRGEKKGVAEELVRRVTERGFTFKEATLRNMGLQAGEGQFTFISYYALPPLSLSSIS